MISVRCFRGFGTGVPSGPLLLVAHPAGFLLSGCRFKGTWRRSGYVMSNITVITLSDEQARIADRLSEPFANYGRADTLENRESNLLGVLGEFALSLYLHSTIEPVVDHRMESLRGAVLSGHVRDDHRDLPGLRVDVKSTRDRNGMGPRNLNLLVPPSQARRPGIAFVLAVPVEPRSGHLKDARAVRLVGWCDSSELEPGTDGRHLGWHRRKGALLWDMSELEIADYAVENRAACFDVSCNQDEAE